MSQLTINCHVTLIVLRTNHYFTSTNVTDEFEDACIVCIIAADELLFNWFSKISSLG